MGPKPTEPVHSAMKPRLTLILSVLTAVAATLVMYANTGLGGIVFTALGAAAMLTLDYGKRIDPVKFRARIIPIGKPRPVSAAELKAA